jgi:hypothetical protein
MAAGSTYTPIATTTLGSAATSYTFTSVPSTYTDIVLVFSGIINGNTILLFNSDTGNNYSQTNIYSQASTTVSSSRESNLSKIYIGDFMNYPLQDGQSNFIMNIQNYANTSVYKTGIFHVNNATGQKIEESVTLWRSTSAINSIQVLSDVTNGIQSGSQLTIYGIAAA